MSATRTRSLLLVAILATASAGCNAALMPTGVSTPDVPVSNSLVSAAARPMRPGPASPDTTGSAQLPR